MTVLSGDDATFLPLLSVGAHGVVSVSSNLFPRAMVAIHKHLAAGRVREAAELHQRFHPLFQGPVHRLQPGPHQARDGARGLVRGLSPRAARAALRRARRKARSELAPLRGLQREQAVIQIGLLGAQGRMGQLVSQLLQAEYASKARLASAPALGQPLDPLLATDVVIDFSAPAAMLSLAELALKRTGTLPAFAVGSTGWTAEERLKLEPLACQDLRARRVQFLDRRSRFDRPPQAGLPVARKARLHARHHRSPSQAQKRRAQRHRAFAATGDLAFRPRQCPDSQRAGRRDHRRSRGRFSRPGGPTSRSAISLRTARSSPGERLTPPFGSPHYSPAPKGKPPSPGARGDRTVLSRNSKRIDCLPRYKEERPHQQRRPRSEYLRLHQAGS